MTPIGSECGRLIREILPGECISGDYRQTDYMTKTWMHYKSLNNAQAGKKKKSLFNKHIKAHVYCAA